MQAGVLGSVPPVGVSWWAGATALNWHCPLGSPCSFEGWVITHTQTLLREASGEWIAVTRHLRRQTVQLRSCVPTGVTSWRYEAWRLVSIHYGTASRRSLDLLHVMKPQSVASNKCVCVCVCERVRARTCGFFLFFIFFIIIIIFFIAHCPMHHDSVLIKRSNLTQQYADIYLLQSHSTCFGRHGARHQEH